MEGNLNSCDLDSVKYATLSNHDDASPQNSLLNNVNHAKYSIERESKSLVDLSAPIKWVKLIFSNPKSIFLQDEPPVRKNTECGPVPNSVITKKMPPSPNNTRLHATHMIQRAQGQLQMQTAIGTHYTPHYGHAGKSIRGSKEKIVYLRERKALKTIGIVVLGKKNDKIILIMIIFPGFIICWMPFFVMYLIEVFAVSINRSYLFKILNEFFLWLGYSNSVSVIIALALCQSKLARLTV